jgi:predicted Zn-dependent peptidase
MLNFYFGTDKKHLYKSLSLIHKEIDALKSKPLSTLQLKQMKEQVLGQMVMAEESLSNLMQMMGKSLLDYNKVESFVQVEKKVNKLTAKALQDVAQEIFVQDQMSQLILLPE